MLAFLSPPVILSVGCCNSFQLFAHQKILRFSHAISLYPFDDSMSRIFLQFLACFSLYLSHLLLLFTRCANSNGFCRCFAFQIGKICCHHDIIRHFQFRKCLPVYSNHLFPNCCGQLHSVFTNKSPCCYNNLNRFC